MSESSFKTIFCPKCGYKFLHEVNITGKAVGGGSGAAAGAAIGAKIGLVAGPFGAIAGTIPGAILGAIFGAKAGESYDNPQCPSCSAKFQLPE